MLLSFIDIRILQKKLVSLACFNTINFKQSLDEFSWRKIIFTVFLTFFCDVVIFKPIHFGHSHYTVCILFGYVTLHRATLNGATFNMAYEFIDTLVTKTHTNHAHISYHNEHTDYTDYTDYT